MGVIMNRINRMMDKEQILEIAKSFLGKRFGDFQGFSYKGNKGKFGILIEEDGYQYQANSDSGPDFPEAGIELKVTPYRENKNKTLSSKERLVLNIIDYQKEHELDFFESSFWKKNKEILILFYKYIDNIEEENLMITDMLLHHFSEEDLEIIKRDRKIIIDKIKDGKADEISEADTMYLGACTKGKDSSSVRTQPFSDNLAMQRAYSLKTTYMSALVRKHIYKNEIEQLFTADQIREKSFEERITDKISKYYGFSQSRLAEMFDLNIKAKNVNESIVNRIFGEKTKLSKTEEFLKANIVVKTIRVEENRSIKESMSFPYFKYTKIIDEEWEDSELRTMLDNTKYLFVVFKKRRGEYYLSNSLFWNMPKNDIDNFAYEVWDATRSLIREGKIISGFDQKGNVKTYFPKTNFSKVMHVRPHGTNKEDMTALPYPDKLTGRTSHTKHCFWFNSKYVRYIINNSRT